MSLSCDGVFATVHPNALYKLIELPTLFKIPFNLRFKFESLSSTHLRPVLMTFYIINHSTICVARPARSWRPARRPQPTEPTSSTKPENPIESTRSTMSERSCRQTKPRRPMSPIKATQPVKPSGAPRSPTDDFSTRLTECFEELREMDARETRPQLWDGDGAKDNLKVEMEKIEELGSVPDTKEEKIRKRDGAKKFLKGVGEKLWQGVLLTGTMGSPRLPRFAGRCSTIDRWRRVYPSQEREVRRSCHD